MRKLHLNICYGRLLSVCLVFAVLTSCRKTDINKEINTQPADQSAVAMSANATNPSNSTTFYGPVQQIGNGHIRSFGMLENQTNKPLYIGFKITAGGLQNLPTGDHATYLVTLHPQVKANSIFDHLVADWNPYGHEPGPYLAAHFDFHFYMLSLSQRLAITANDSLSLKPLASGYLPGDYIGPLGPEPQMGGHCVDLTSPELGVFAAPVPFTHTFIYGAYNGKVAFYEPMVTLSYLTNSTGTFNIKQPTYFSQAGYYPTKYSILNENGTRSVVLSEFVYHTAN